MRSAWWSVGRIAILIVLAVFWAFAVASLLSERDMQRGLASGSVTPFLLAVSICLVASVVGLFRQFIGGVLYIIGGVLIPIAGFWVTNGPLSIAPFGAAAVLVGVALILSSTNVDSMM